MRRDTLEKSTMPLAGIADQVNTLLEEIQDNIYNKAVEPQRPTDTRLRLYEDFKARIEDGGFFLCHWDGTTETEELIKAETKGHDTLHTPRRRRHPGVCMVTGKPSASRRVIIARNY